MELGVCVQEKCARIAPRNPYPSEPLTPKVESMINPDEINKLATLARININPDIVSDVTVSLNSILTLVDQLQAVDTQGVEPLSHPMDAVQRLRTDEVTETDQRDALQRNAPAVEAGLFLVPKVID